MLIHFICFYQTLVYYGSEIECEWFWCNFGVKLQINSILQFQSYLFIWVYPINDSLLKTFLIYINYFLGISLTRSFIYLTGKYANEVLGGNDGRMMEIEWNILTWINCFIHHMFVSVLSNHYKKSPILVFSPRAVVV